SRIDWSFAFLGCTNQAPTGRVRLWKCRAKASSFTSGGRCASVAPQEGAMTMKKSVMMLVMAMFVATAAQAAAPVPSLNDLPSEWHGIGGARCDRVPVSLTLNRILGVDRRTDDGALSVVYKVDASLKLGEQTLAIKQMWLRSYSASSNTYYEMYLTLD